MKAKIILFCLTLCCLFACSKEDENNEVVKNSEPANKNEYYVKYHYQANGFQHYCGFDIVYVNKETENSNPAVNTISYQYPNVQSYRIDQELICGPFEYGEKASLRMTNENSVLARLLEIYVSKNNSPFALRKSTTNNTLEYTIDY